MFRLRSDTYPYFIVIVNKNVFVFKVVLKFPPIYFTVTPHDINLKLFFLENVKNSKSFESNMNTRSRTVCFYVYFIVFLVDTCITHNEQYRKQCNLKNDLSFKNLSPKTQQVCFHMTSIHYHAPHAIANDL